MVQTRQLKVVKLSREEATRFFIQSEFMKLLHDMNFSFEADVKVPRGVQTQVLKNINGRMYDGEPLNTVKSVVSDWCTKVKQNGWRVVAVQTDYTKSSQNRRKFYHNEQKAIRDKCLNDGLKANKIGKIYSEKEQKYIDVSASSARRALKRKLSNEPSCWPAKPKGLRVGGRTPHHDRCRLYEANWWLTRGQEFVDGVWMADETKIQFREHRNKVIDIVWVPRGEASEANWYENPRWPGQINLFILQTKTGISMYDIYNKNMNMDHYKELLTNIKDEIRESGEEFTCYLHDNFCRGSQPVAELNHCIGEGRWTKYMGRPCTQPHPFRKTPKRKIPVRMPKPVCECTFPQGPVHAAFNPKLNLCENTFAELDRIMTRNKIEDEKLDPPRKWIMKGTDKKAWWRDELIRAIQQLNERPEYFENQYNGYLDRCRKFVASNGKRQKLSKY